MISKTYNTPKRDAVKPLMFILNLQYDSLILYMSLDLEEELDFPFLKYKYRIRQYSSLTILNYIHHYRYGLNHFYEQHTTN